MAIAKGVLLTAFARRGIVYEIEDKNRMSGTETGLMYTEGPPR